MAITRISVDAAPVEQPPKMYAIGWDIERRGFIILFGNDIVAKVASKESIALLEQITTQYGEL